SRLRRSSSATRMVAGCWGLSEEMGTRGSLAQCDRPAPPLPHDSPQLERDFPAALGALRRVLREQAQDELLELLGEIGLELAQGPRRLVHLHHQERHELVALEGDLPGEELIGDDAEGVDV